MAKTTNISSITQFAQLVSTAPTIMNFAAFAPLKEVIAKVANQKGCKCNQKTTLSSYRPQFEAGMSMLSMEDQTRLKALLGTDQVCYYSTNGGGQIRKICF